jgi:hypothetical protein
MLVRPHILPSLPPAVGPCHLHPVSARGPAQPEVLPQHALREVTGTAPHPPRLYHPTRLHPHARTDPAAVGPARQRRSVPGPSPSPPWPPALYLDLQPVPCPSSAPRRAALVPQQLRWTIVVAHQDVEVAVPVVVAIGSPAAHLFVSERRARRAAHLFEAAVPSVAKQQRPLPVGQVVLRELDIIVDVSVGNERVRARVVVHIEEEEPEPQRQQAGRPKARRE